MPERSNSIEIIDWPDGSSTELLVGAIVTPHALDTEHISEPEPELELEAEPKPESDPEPEAEQPGSLMLAKRRKEQDVGEWLALRDAVVGSNSLDETDPLEWQERALCAQTDPEAFFPEKGKSNTEAKRICLGCEVRDDCLKYALEHDEQFGIWGGMSEHQRRKLKKRAV